MNFWTFRESGIGTYIDDEIGTSSCDLDFSKTSNNNTADKKLTNSYQNTDTESLDKLNLDNSAGSTNEAYYSNNNQQNKMNKSHKSKSKFRHLSKSKTVYVESAKNAQFLLEEDIIFESKATGWFSWFFKTFFAFLLFFLTIIFVIFVYFFYSLVLNPSCCDYQRQYLMFNVS